MTVADDVLMRELKSFAERVMSGLTFARAAAMLDADEEIHEYHDEPPAESYFEVEASLLYRDSDASGEYISILFSAMDLRPKGFHGSAYSPILFQASITENGAVEFGGFSQVPAGGGVRDF